MQYQPGPFEPVAIYDTPWMVATQALEGTLTWRSFIETLTGGDALSPQQRESYVKRLKDKVGGGNPAVEAAIGIATNPWVIAGALMGPAGAEIMRKGGGRIFGSQLRKSGVPYILRTTHQMTEGTGAGEGLEGLIRSVKSHLHDFSQGGRGLRGVEELEEKLFQKLGVTAGEWVDPGRIRNVAKRDQVEKVRMAILGKLAGLDRTRFIKNPKLIPRIWRWEGQGKGWVGIIDDTQKGYYWKQMEQDLLTGRELPILDDLEGFGDVPTPGQRQKAIAEGMEGVHVRTSKGLHYVELPQDMNYGGSWVKKGTFDDVLDAIPEARALQVNLREQMKQRFIDLYAKEGVTRAQLMDAQAAGKVDDLIDEEKVFRQWRGTATVDGVGRDISSFEDFASVAMGRNMRAEMLALAKHATMRQDWTRYNKRAAQLRKDVRRAFAANIDFESYMPRTMTEWYNVPTQALPGDHQSWVKMEAQQVADLKRRNWQDLASGRSLQQLQADPFYHPEDLARFEELFKGQTSRYFKGLGQRYERTMRDLHSGKRKMPVAFQRMDLVQSLRRYERQTAQDYGLFVEKMSPAEIRAQKEAIRNLKESAKAGDFTGFATDVTGRSQLGPEIVELENGIILGIPGKAADRTIYRTFDSDEFAPTGGWSRMDLFDQSETILRNYHTEGIWGNPAKLFREVLLPTALGNNHHHYGMTKALVHKTQDAARKLSSSAWFQEVAPEGMKDWFHQFAHRDPAKLAPAWNHNAAGWIYSSTLGANLASVILNITQPMMHLAAWTGLNNTLPAYKDAMADITRYYQHRFKMFPRAQITSAERRQVVDRAGIHLWEQTGLGGNVLEDLDRLAFAEGYRLGGKGQFILQELPLKLFEKGEWLNRLVAAHTTRRMYEKAGRITTTDRGIVGRAAGDLEDFQEDARRMVLESQFGSDPLNTPAIFMAGDFNPLRNPLMRQFMTFTARTPLAFFQVGGSLAQGKRRVRGTNLQVPWLVGDGLRAVGLSALLYETYKAFGADPSNVGIVPAVADIWGGEKILERDAQAFPMLTPPVVDIGMDFLRGIFGDEAQLVGDGFARLIPGGVAIQRGLGVMPEAKGLANIAGIPHLLQRTYADWANPNPEGKVPVYKGDGSLVDFQSPTHLIMKGMGVPVQETREAGQFDRYLQKNRDRILEMRRDILNAYLSNNPAKGQKLEQQFEKEFGIPFTVTKRQLSDRIKARTVPRTERMLDRMPREMRDTYLELAAQSSPRLGLPEDIYRGESRSTTSSRRAAAGAAAYQHALPDSESLQQIRRAMQRQQMMEEAASGYAPFTSF